MKNYKLLIHPFAELDMTDAKEWYDLQQEGLGNKFVSEIRETVKCIQENPFQFPKEKKNIRKAIVHKFPYSIFFYTNKELINIFAFFHSSRNPLIWQKRFKNQLLN